MQNATKPLNSTKTETQNKSIAVLFWWSMPQFLLWDWLIDWTHESLHSVLASLKVHSKGCKESILQMLFVAFCQKLLGLYQMRIFLFLYLYLSRWVNFWGLIQIEISAGVPYFQILLFQCRAIIPPNENGSWSICVVSPCCNIRWSSYLTRRSFQMA